jgi:hypothetical protein
LYFHPLLVLEVIALLVFPVEQPTHTTMAPPYLLVLPPEYSLVALESILHEEERELGEAMGKAPASSIGRKPMTAATKVDSHDFGISQEKGIVVQDFVFI